MKDFEQLYKQADECVYLSKEKKGNAVTFYNDVVAANEAEDASQEEEKKEPAKKSRTIAPKKKKHE